MKVWRVAFLAAISISAWIAEVKDVHAGPPKDFEITSDSNPYFGQRIVQTSRDCASGFGVPVWKDPATRPIGVVCMPPTPDGG